VILEHLAKLVRFEK